jgi:hypothetical protein
MEEIKITCSELFFILFVEFLLTVADERFGLDCSDVEDFFHRREAGFKIRQIFFGAERSGGPVLAKISEAERSGGAVPSKKFGAELSESICRCFL